MWAETIEQRLHVFFAIWWRQVYGTEVHQLPCGWKNRQKPMVRHGASRVITRVLSVDRGVSAPGFFYREADVPFSPSLAGDAVAGGALVAFLSADHPDLDHPLLARLEYARVNR
jgi:hypothetical protein